MDSFGFLKVAAAVPHVRVGDCDFNAERMAAMADEAAQRGVEIVAFPELALTAYTCGDLLLQPALLDAADEAMDKEFHGKYEIWGGDIDPDAVELSRHNAELAEVDDIVKFEVDDATRFHWGGLYGRIVTNPPYGERLLEREEAGELYKAFGKAMDKLPDTWRVYVLSSHPDFERCYGRFADKKRKLYNGMLKCDLFMYGKRL